MVLNLVQKIKIASYSWNLNLENSIVEFTFLNSLFWTKFKSEIAFIGKFGQKNQNYQFILKFCTKTNSKMQNSIAVLTFLLLAEITLFG